MDPHPSNGPPPFNPSDHGTGVGQAFKRWVDRFEIFCDHVLEDPSTDDHVAMAKYAKAKKRKLLWYIGGDALTDIETASPDIRTDNTMTYEAIIDKLRQRYQPKASRWQAISQYRSLYQEPGESLSKFADRCRRATTLCGFDSADFNEGDPVILGTKIQLILGTSSQVLRDAAIQKNWTLQEIVSNGMLFEDSASASQSVTNGNAQAMAAVPEEPEANKLSGRYSKKFRRQAQLQPRASGCSRCGSPSAHRYWACPAKDRTCSNCNRIGHFHTQCRNGLPRQELPKTKETKTRKEPPSRNSRRVKTATKHEMHSSSEGTEPESDEEAHYLKVFMANTSKTEALQSPRVTFLLNGAKISGVADSGAQINVIPRRLAPSSLLKSLVPTKIKIKPYGASSKPIFPLGEAIVDTTWNNITLAKKWFVVEDLPSRPMVPLLSCETCTSLGIITINLPGYTRDGTDVAIRTLKQVSGENPKIMKRFRSVFEGVGLLKGHEVELHLVDNPRPVACPPRYIPFHLEVKVHHEIDQMLKDDIIETHHGPAPWVSNVQVAHIPIPTIDSIKAGLVGCKVFSKLDFRSSFHQLSLSDSSKLLTVFRVGESLYHFKRLPMGVKPASGEFMKAIRNNFSDIVGLHAVHDDIIIAGKTKETHDASLKCFLERLRETGMTLNPDKCIFGKQQIPFWGMIVSGKGIRPDPEKVKNLREAPKPRNKDDLVSFLCMARSNAAFIPFIARETTHLRELTTKHAKFRWTRVHQREFDNLRRALHESACLTFFDVNLPTFLLVDAHRDGLCAMLCQGEDIEHLSTVAISSRATTDVEKRYPQIDLEAMAINHGLTKMKIYLVGNPCVTIVTDHKPLIPIFRGTRPGSVRTERIILRHQDIAYKIVWRAGKSNPADFFSRHATPLNELSTQDMIETEEMEKLIYATLNGDVLQSLTPDVVYKQTRRDKQLKKLKKAIRAGCLPSNTPGLSQYGRIFSELTISDGGNVLRGARLVLPRGIRSQAIKLAHGGSHLGASSMKRRLRTVAWFPGMDRDIEIFVSECDTCRTTTEKATRVEQRPHRTPEAAWNAVSIDHFGPLYNNSHILVVRCDLSRFPAAVFVRSTSSMDTIEALREIYTTYGFPSKQRSDNGPAFRSREFSDFCAENDITHTYVAPHHPRANPAETFMRVLKKTLQSCGKSLKSMRVALQSCLRAYRTTPHPVTKIPPSALMFSNYRSELLTIPGATENALRDARQRDQQHRHQIAKTFNSKPKTKPSQINPGQWVILRDFYRSSKFQPKFRSTPHLVLNRESHATFSLRNSETDAVVIRHEDDLKLIPQPPQNTQTSISPPASEFPFWLDDKSVLAANPPHTPDTLPNEPHNATSPPLQDSAPETEPSKPTASPTQPTTLSHYRPDHESQDLLLGVVRRFKRHRVTSSTSSASPRPKRSRQPPNRLGFGRVHLPGCPARVRFRDSSTIIPHTSKLDDDTAVDTPHPNEEHPESSGVMS